MCSIRNSEKTWRSLLCTTTMVHDDEEEEYEQIDKFWNSLLHSVIISFLCLESLADLQ